METKDLVLLMLIPVMLISLVVYTDKNTTITGAQTAQMPKPAQDNILGTYSIMPSFRANIDYNIQDEYGAISQQASQMVDDCKNNANIEQCLKTYSIQLSWTCNDLRDESVDILYDFIDKLNECINLEEDGVVCRFSLDERSIMNLPNSFDITLTSEDEKTRVQVKRGTQVFEDYVNLDNLAYTDYNNRDKNGESINPIKYIVDYSSRKPVIADAFGIDENSKRIPLSKTMLLYKKDNVVKFVEAPGSSFEAPVPANKVIDLPRIRGFRFCAKSPGGKKFYAYDKSDGSIKSRDIVYKFSVTYPK